MDSNRLWTSFVTILLGMWLLVTPCTFGTQSSAMLGSDLICGALLIVFGWYHRKPERAWSPWILGLIGIWIQFAPLAFWAQQAASYLNNTLVGALVVVFALLFPEPTAQEEPSIPPGWSYNPSSWPQRLLIALFAFFCWMVSRYLAAFELGYISFAWDPFFDHGTETVLTSTISRAFPVPDAGLGAFAYTLEFLATCQGGTARWRTSPWLVLIFGILVIPVGMTSIILVLLQPLAVGAWCTLCLAAALCMLISIPFAIDEVIASMHYLRHSKEKPFWTLLFKGGPCPGAKKDRHTPPLTSSLLTLLKASFEGVHFPWHLLCSMGIGIVLMMLPWPFHIHGVIEDLDPIIGAFTIVFAVLAFADLARKLQWINLLCALTLLVAALSASGTLSFPLTLIHVAIALVLGCISLCKARI